MPPLTWTCIMCLCADSGGCAGVCLQRVRQRQPATQSA